MNQEKSPPPNELKPWYYQDWFLFPMFMFWPLWAVLILRSPWHNGLVSGAVAWAMLIAGSYLVVTRLQMGGTVLQSTLMIIVPGLILTVVTQVLWFQDKQKLREREQQPGPDSESTTPRESGKAGGQRQARRRRNSRSGRSSRGG